MTIINIKGGEKMNVVKYLSYAWDILLTIFIIRGLLSEFGVVPKFTADDIYTFAYLGFAVGAYTVWHLTIDKEDVV